MPASLPLPLDAWRTPYEAISREDELTWSTLEEMTRAAQAFLDPVLAGSLDAMWEPALLAVALAQLSSDARALFVILTLPPRRAYASPRARTPFWSTQRSTCRPPRRT